MTSRGVKGTCLTLLLAALFLLSGAAKAQQADTLPETMSQPLSARAAHHSPQKALLLSSLLPGAGQVYNKQAWKVPIVYAALGTGAYFIATNYASTKAHKDEYLYRVHHGDQPSERRFADYPTTNIYNMYETYNQWFQLSVIVTVGMWGLNMLDAFVFGHLFEYDMGDDITLLVAPTWQYVPQWGMTPAAGVTLLF